jgi:hypothetical protein
LDKYGCSDPDKVIASVIEKVENERAEYNKVVDLMNKMMKINRESPEYKARENAIMIREIELGQRIEYLKNR